MTRYRYATPTRLGRWHATRREAKEAALKAKAAHKDEQGRIVLNPLTEIEQRDSRQE